MKPRIKKLLLGGICAGFIGLLAMGAEKTQADAVIMRSFSAVTNPEASVGSAEHPFRILEIVPNESMGMMGYMIDGCEPISMERLAAEEYGANGETQLYRDNMVTSGLVAEASVVSYAFAEALPEGAMMATFPNEFGKWELKTNVGVGSMPDYSEFGFYENMGDGNGAFAYDEASGTFVYVGDAKGTHSWNCTAYYVGDGAGGATSTVVVDTSGEDMSVTDINTRYWTYRADREYYTCRRNEFTHNDSFLQVVFGEGMTVKNGFVAEVVTITPDRLVGDNLSMIEQADMIVMTAQDYMTPVWDAYNLDGIVRTDAEKAARPTTFLGANGNDLTWDATLRIVDRMASATPPAMYLQAPALYDGLNAGEYNVGKLYVMLMQYGANVFKNSFMDGNANLTVGTYTTSDGKEVTGGVFAKYNETSGQTEKITNWDQNTFLTSYGTGVMHEAAFPLGATGEVFGTILLYNGDMSFMRSFLTSKVSEIVSSNPDYPTGSNSEMFDYFEQMMGTRPTELGFTNAVQYIVGNALQMNTTIAKKTHLNVLEIQPCNQFVYGSENWQLYYMSMFPWFAGSIYDDVTVTTMTTYQFIGDIVDLNSEYDLIVIGSKQDASNGLNGYNDTSMNNYVNGNYESSLIYTSIGDIVTEYNANWSSGNEANGGRDERMGSDAWQMKSRYSGSDITKKKYEELCDFMASGSPIMVDAGLYKDNTTEVDTTKVDINSWTYMLANKAFSDDSMLFCTGIPRDYQEQVRLKYAFTQESGKFVFASDGSGLPQEYSVTTREVSVQMNNNRWVTVPGVIDEEIYNRDTDGDGNPVLRYTFSVEGNPYTSYGVRLYLDHNGDGIFNDSIKERKELAAAGKAAVNTNTTLTSEEANGNRMSVYDMTSQSYVWPDQLVAGHTYQLVYRVRSSERGIIPWKLELFDENNNSIRNSVKGYAAFPVSGDVEIEQINVLQMNLMADMSVDRTSSVNFADAMRDRPTTETGAKFKAYLEAVKDFNVNIEYMKNSDWYAEFGEYGRTATSMGYTKEVQIARWKTFLEEYDMLVIGFCDMTSYTNDEIFLAGFNEFINQGKSVILSHDLASDSSFIYTDIAYATENDPAIRTLAGQRRKYYIDGTNYYRYSSTMLNGHSVSLLPPVDFTLWYSSTGSWQKLPKEKYMSEVKTNLASPELQEMYGSEFMDNSIRLMLIYSNRGLNKDRVLNSNITSFSWPVTTQDIEIANKGQVTTYPYTLGNTMKVATTHVQNFQLDLEQEDGGDVTVWYNLTDSYDSDVRANGTNDGVYSSRSGDARNNYYIYTKGNITYTGLGHSNATLTNDEVKLFVNTMISSYREVPLVPYAKVENADASEHKGDYVLYVPLTGAENLSDTIKIDMSVIDENDYNITSVRSYRLRYMDEMGNPLENTVETTSPNGSMLNYIPETKEYQVQQGGKYVFHVPCQTVLEEGEAVYYVEVSSSYYAGTKEYTTSKVTKIVVYAMPLFSLH